MKLIKTTVCVNLYLDTLDMRPVNEVKLSLEIFIQRTMPTINHVANTASHQTQNKEQCMNYFHHSLVKSNNLTMDHNSLVYCLSFFFLVEEWYISFLYINASGN